MRSRLAAAAAALALTTAACNAGPAAPGASQQVTNEHLSQQMGQSFIELSKEVEALNDRLDEIDRRLTEICSIVDDLDSSGVRFAVSFRNPCT